MQRLLGLRPEGLCPGRNSQETTYIAEGIAHLGQNSGGGVALERGWVAVPTPLQGPTVRWHRKHRAAAPPCRRRPGLLSTLSAHVPTACPQRTSVLFVDAAWRGAGSGLNPGILWSAACTRHPASEVQPLGPPEPGTKRRAQLIPRLCSYSPSETCSRAGAPQRLRAASNGGIRHRAGQEEAEGGAHASVPP